MNKENTETKRAMVSFTVTSVIDGDTFDVTPGWKWNNETGTRIRPAGYDAPELERIGGQEARHKLSLLVYRETVELGRAYRIDRGRLVCEVFFRGRNLAEYFPECG